MLHMYHTGTLSHACCTLVNIHCQVLASFLRYSIDSTYYATRWETRIDIMQKYTCDIIMCDTIHVYQCLFILSSILFVPCTGSPLDITNSWGTCSAFFPQILSAFWRRQVAQLQTTCTYASVQTVKQFTRLLTVKHIDTTSEREQTKWHIH